MPKTKLSNSLDFSGQKFYVGLEVYNKSCTVTVRTRALKWNISISLLLCRFWSAIYSGGSRKVSFCPLMKPDTSVPGSIGDCVNWGHQYCGQPR
ncbi:MAG TPA: hypothetical protein VNE41_09280 [Chitinophagaceae bacterium]|nr:hypothetical protein [Chitinophagaceae bacterium]